MSKWLNCNTPFQELVMMHISENFFTDDVELELINDGVRLTDKTGAVADFIYNHDTGRIDMKDLDSKEIKRVRERQKAVELIQQELLK